MKHNVILLATILILTSCSSKQEPVIKALKDDNNCVVLPLNSLDDIVPVQMDSLYEDLFYIQPEVTENSLIGEYSKIIIKDSMLFIMDKGKSNQAIFVFDMKGKYLFSINKRGNGPGEYVSIGDFYVDEKTKTIGVLDHSQILRYTYDGTFLGKINLQSHYILNIASVDSLIYTYGYSQCPTKRCYSFKIFDLSGNLLYEDLPERKDLISFHLTGFKGNNLFLDNNNTVYYNSIYNDTIYEVNIDRITPRYIADFGKFKLSDDIYSGLVEKGDSDVDETLSFISSLNYVLFGFRDIFFTKDYCSYFFATGKRNYTAFYSKKTGNVKITSSIQTIGIIPIQSVSASDNNYFYAQIYTDSRIMVKEQYEKAGVLDPTIEFPIEMRKYYDDFLKNAKEEDNTSIVGFKLRDF